jgi:cytochrome b561
MKARRYTAVAIALHWGIAVLIGVNLLLGWRMGGLKGLAKFDTFQLHKSVGLTILVLSLARLAWRLWRPPPPEPATLRPWERAASATVHWSFYAIMIGMPLTGWAAATASPLNIPTLVFHVLPWPGFPGVHGLGAPARRSVETLTGGVHLALAWAMVALLALHIGAALKHQFIDDDAVLARMVPGLPTPDLAPSAAKDI